MALTKDSPPSSFRGVAFEARDAGFSTGRRVIVHEFPQRDVPQSEDNGRTARRWRLQAFIVGREQADVQARKRALVEACEAYGPGALVHPTDGTLRVQCESLEVSESSDGLGYVEFSLTFVEAGTTFAPVAATSRVRTLGDDLRAAVRDFYAARLQVRSVARKVSRVFNGDVEERVTAVLELGGVLSGNPDDVADFVTAVRVLADTYETGVEDGAGFLTDWQAAFGNLSDTDDLRRVGDRLGDTFEESAAAYPGTGTETDALILSNRYLTDLALYGSALTRAAEVAAQATFAAYDDALSVSTDLGDRLADLEGRFEGDPTVYGALVDLRRTMNAAILTGAIDLPRLRTLTVPVPSLALTLAFDLYGDTNRATELVARNRIPDPNAVTGDLRVLTE